MPEATLQIQNAGRTNGKAIGLDKVANCIKMHDAQYDIILGKLQIVCNSSKNCIEKKILLGDGRMLCPYNDRDYMPKAKKTDL